jgi:hypothetical protein
MAVNEDVLRQAIGGNRLWGGAVGLYQILKDNGCLNSIKALNLPLLDNLKWSEPAIQLVPSHYESMVEKISKAYNLKSSLDLSQLMSACWYLSDMSISLDQKLDRVVELYQRDISSIISKKNRRVASR